MTKETLEQFLGKSGLSYKDVSSDGFELVKDTDDNNRTPVTVLIESKDNYLIINERNLFYIPAELNDYHAELKPEEKAKPARRKRATSKTTEDKT